MTDAGIMAAVCRIVDQIMGNLFSIEIRRHFLTKRKAQALILNIQVLKLNTVVLSEVFNWVPTLGFSCRPAKKNTIFYRFPWEIFTLFLAHFG